MDVKPSSYGSVPPYLCIKCLLYDVREMVKASSKFAVSTVSSALSARPSCSVAASTCGLSFIDVL